jgi:pimeloyl-ACP methyl ester carboxylesterase
MTAGPYGAGMITNVSDEALVKRLPGFANGYAVVNGVRLHFVEGGSGEPLLLLGGWPQTWWEFNRIMPDLANQFHVIAVDLRAIHADHGWYQTFGQDIADLQSYGQLTMPVLGLGGLFTPYLAAFLPERCTDVTIVELKDTGHWLPEERPKETTSELVKFFQ